LDASDSEPANATLASPVIDRITERSIDYELYENPVEHSAQELPRNSPTLPDDSPMASAADPSLGTGSTADYDHDTEIIEAMETEIILLIANIFECLNDGRFAELTALISDLEWGLSELANTFPRFSLIQQLAQLLRFS
jgi:hypothetical protein